MQSTGDILTYNSLNGLKLLPESNKRNVILTPETAAKLIDHLPHPADDIVEFAIYTGFRKSNILSLTIEQVHFYPEKGTADVELELKGGRYENYPIVPHAVEIIKRNISSRHEGYVFFNLRTGTHMKDIHKSFDKAVRILNLTVNGTKLRFHDLRHIAVTWLHQQGIGDDILQELLGHRNRETTERYITRNRSALAQVLLSLPKIERKKPSEMQMVRNTAV